MLFETKKIIESWGGPKIRNWVVIFGTVFTCKRRGIESRDRFQNSFLMLDQMNPHRKF